MASNTQPPFDSAQLYAACASMDQVEQAEAYRILWAYLFRVAFRITFHQPDATALAQDCAQVALIKVHEQQASCRKPEAFRAWTRRIVSNLTIDELRRRKRLLPLNETDLTTPTSPTAVSKDGVMNLLTAEALRDLLAEAPISDRSRRVVIGRFLDNIPDEVLAEKESELARKPVRPSHVQVTRAKNLAKLRRWEKLRVFLQEAT